MDGAYIVVNKEKDITSFSCCAKIKYLTGLKCGHTGTLDPLAEGVLPILMGTATKLSNLIMEGEKEYIAGGLLGYSTDTLDITGKKIKEVDISSFSISREDFQKVLNEFKGQIKQLPPMYSALKKDGKKLYELARAGIEVEREEREITIRSIDLLDFTPPTFKIRVSCSKGTYIRTLIDDIGSRLGIPATMESLIRTKTGPFTLYDSVKVKDLTKENIKNFIKPIEELFLEYDKIVVDSKTLKLLTNGVKIKDTRILSEFPKKGTYRIYSKDIESFNSLVSKNDVRDEFIGLAEKKNSEVSLIYRVQK